MSELAPDDVVQISPEANKRFAGCFAIVDEVRAWGVVAHVLIPSSPQPEQAPLRLSHGGFQRIGPSVWSPDREGEQDE